MLKKAIFFTLFIITMITGCSNKAITSNNISNYGTNKQDKISNAKSIPFKYLYAGFVIQNNKDLPIDNKQFPVGTVVINTDKEWQDFTYTYFKFKNSVSRNFEYADMAYKFPNGTVDFSKESIIYNSQLSAKSDVYAVAYQIDKIEIENNKPNVLIKEFDNGLRITTSNFINFDHRYIILISINKSDLPK